MVDRPDGRPEDQMRPLKIEVGVLERADGSARAELGNNMAIASVFGPRELHPKHSSRADRALVRVYYRMATFSVTDYKRPFPSRREKEISKVLSSAFENIILTKQFPRSAIDVTIQIFESDGGTRTIAAIAASAALADAGIPMRDLAGAIASGVYEDTVVLDLSGHEDMKGTGDMPIVYSPSIDEVGLFQLDGLFTLDQFKKAFSYSKQACISIVEAIKDALKQRYLAVKDEIAAGEDDANEEDIIAEQSQEVITEDEPEVIPIRQEGEQVESLKSKIIAESETKTFFENAIPQSESETSSEEVLISKEEIEQSPGETSDIPSPNQIDDQLDEEILTEKSSKDNTSAGDETEEGDSQWYNQSPTTLKPMGSGDDDPEDEEKEDEEKEESDTGEDILRDLEYIEEND